MRILVINCNTTASMTEGIAEIARAAAGPGTEIIAIEPSWGVESAEGFYDSFISAAAILDVITTTAERFDAVVMAGFGEHGREGARQLLDVPVVDITEAAAELAILLGHRFGVVTTTASALASIEHSLLTAGLAGRCTGYRAADLGVLDLDHDLDRTAEALVSRGRELVAAGADVLVLGCAGMAGMDARVEAALQVPVIDGVAAAVGLCEVLVGLGKSTSKRGPYAAPSSTKRRPGWPPSAFRDHAGLGVGPDTAVDARP